MTTAFSGKVRPCLRPALSCVIPVPVNQRNTGISLASQGKYSLFYRTLWYAQRHIILYNRRHFVPPSVTLHADMVMKRVNSLTAFETCAALPDSPQWCWRKQAPFWYIGSAYVMEYAVLYFTVSLQGVFPQTDAGRAQYSFNSKRQNKRGHLGIYYRQFVICRDMHVLRTCYISFRNISVIFS